MEVQDLIAQARDTLTVKRVFGEPYEKNGMTIIPAVRVQGGAGAGAARMRRARARGRAAGSRSPPARSGHSSSGKVN
jgi:uncharacterized spore protein YtfJ